MQFLVKNTTPVGDLGKIIYVDASVLEGQIYPLGPQETLPVSDSSKDMLVKLYPDYIQVIGTYTDEDAPVALAQPLTTSWVLADLGKYCTQFKFITTDTIAKISFSGWDTAKSETEPPTKYQISIPPTSTANNAFEFEMTMNPSRYIYVKGTNAATLTIFGI